MAKIAFLIMAHKDPQRVVEQARALLAHGDCVAIHFDARASAADHGSIRAALEGVPGVAFARRVRCGWGQWSLVQATLNLICEARRQFEGITHYYLLSGDCYPTKSRGYLDRYLGDGADVIESRDFFTSGWIRTGMKEERLIYRHWFNERERPWLFYRALEVQRRLQWQRSVPAGLRMRIGSQWWALRASTVERLLEFMRERPDIVRFFRTTWIPDETFFQTLVSHLVPAAEVRQGPPTHLIFSDYGMPVVFQHDHLGYLRADDRPFARKMSTHANGLRRRLLDIFRERESAALEGGGSDRVYAYLAGRGRYGQRYAQRFWERAIAPNRDAEVLIVVSKLWHVGGAIERAAADAAGLVSLGYVFDEDRDLRVCLGNLERGLGKRRRHRGALLNLLHEATGSDRLILAIDPSRIDAIADVAGRAGDARLLLVDRPISDVHLRDHAERVGLLGPSSGDFERREVVTTLRNQFTAEIESLRLHHRGRLWLNRLDRPRAANVEDLARFLRLSPDRVGPIAAVAERYSH